MNNNKQTSVEWLVDWMKNNQYFIGNDLLQAVEQAKAMHKEEMKEMYLKGIENYDPTFKRKDNQTFEGGNNG